VAPDEVAPPTPETLDVVAQLRAALKEQQDLNKQVIERLNQLTDQGNAHDQFLQKIATAGPGAIAAGAPGAAPGAPTQGFTDPQAAKAADTMRLMNTALQMIDGGGGAAPAAGGMDYQALLAKAAFDQLTSTANLNNAISSAIAESVKGKVKSVVGGALPTFQ